ncbi:hypothetical protein NIES932_26570 [Raphidiopsis curvata NIES-932]|nr:hypothetical protein NIES932_26570 [Raphidiopsis curvata NIES-932]
MKLSAWLLVGLLTSFGVSYIMDLNQFLSQQNDLTACTRTKKGQPSDNKGENPSRT